MRLIDGHELYRQIPLKVCLPCPFGEEKECKDCVIDKVMKVIDEAPTVAASPWHRVEDQLPEPGQDVLVYTYFYGRSIYAVAWLDNEGKWSFGTVTHWMPIEPPKEDA